MSNCGLVYIHRGLFMKRRTFMKVSILDHREGRKRQVYMYVVPGVTVALVAVEYGIYSQCLDGSLGIWINREGLCHPSRVLQDDDIVHIRDKKITGD